MDSKTIGLGLPDSVSEILRKIATEISSCVSHKYFETLVTSIAENLNFDTVFIGQFIDAPTSFIQTKATFSEDKIIENFTYDLAGTPCENVLINKEICIYTHGVQHNYPKDLYLQNNSMEGYVGTPLVSNYGKTLGLIFALSKKPITNEAAVIACFDMVAGRTAAEMEHQLAEEHARKLSQVVEQSPVTVVISNLQGNIEYVNKHFETTTGYTKKEVLGKNPRLMKSGETTAAEYSNLWKTISNDNVWSGEFHNKRKDGSKFWERATIGPLKDTQDQTVGFIAIKEDISLEKENEKELRLASAVFDSAAEAIMVSDASNTIQKVNQAFCSITGYNPKEVLNHTPSLLQSGRHNNHFYDEMYNSLHAGDSWEGEIWNRRKNGEVYPIWLTISAMRDKSGKLEGYISLFSDITKRKLNESRIYNQANFDSLTGLANRSLFMDRCAQALSLAERKHDRVALLFLDLDGFKNVNDTLGHPVGDQLLQEAANRIKESFRQSDTVARLGGDEFGIILSDNLKLHSIENLVIHLMESIAHPYFINTYKVFVSVSIGVAVYPTDGKNTETLLRKADNAMYRAKAKGRNNFQFFTQEMDIEAQQRRELETDLRQASDNNEFTLNFQPVIDINSNKVASAEALIRWKHPKKGYISPAEFIPLAEEVGLITSIGAWVLREACRVAESWSKSTESAPSISVNVSSKQFQRQNIPALVKQVLMETGLPANKLTLEITESLLTLDDNDTLYQLSEIRHLGVGLSIDDFGTGYSSLSYLKKFPINILKIDQSFIKDLLTDHENIALVDAMLAMAKSLGLEVVAEGVEEEEQKEHLKAANCQFIQGYFYSKPLPNSELITYLNEFK